MNQLYVAKGHNSWTNADLKRVFKTRDEAQRFCEGLTNSSIKFYNADSQIDVINLLLREENR